MSKVSNCTHSKSQLDHYSNQNNPNSQEYKANLDNRANQLNPNNAEFKGRRFNNDSSHNQSGNVNGNILTMS